MRWHQMHVLTQISRRDSLQPVRLDQVPNYATAISSPEVFSNDIDPSPAYSASTIAPIALHRTAFDSYLR